MLKLVVLCIFIRKCFCILIKIRYFCRLKKKASTYLISHYG